MARPRKEIDRNVFENLCGIMCTLEEIAGVFNCCGDTIESWCKRTYRESFSDVYKKFSARGKQSLRRYQFELAKKNATMAIWLGKQWLGQKDEQVIEVNRNTDETLKAMDEYFADAGTDFKDNQI